MPTETARTLEAQVEAAHTIQRSAGGKMVVFHLEDPTESGVGLFPNRAQELYVGRVWLDGEGASRRISCDLVTHRGRISSLELSASPSDLDAESVTCSRIEWFHDLSKPSGRSEEGGSGTPSGPTLQRIRDQADVRNVQPPVSEDELRRFLHRLGAAVPDDYVDLLRETNGFDVAGWRFLGTRARRLPWPEASYQVLAELDPRALAVREGEEAPRVVFLDQVNEETRELGGSFVESWLEVMA